jgi:hypothetical protein
MPFPQQELIMQNKAKQSQSFDPALPYGMPTPKAGQIEDPPSSGGANFKRGACLLTGLRVIVRGGVLLMCSRGQNDKINNNFEEKLRFFGFTRVIITEV